MLQSLATLASSDDEETKGVVAGAKRWWGGGRTAGIKQPPRCSSCLKPAWHLPMTRFMVAYQLAARDWVGWKRLEQPRVKHRSHAALHTVLEQFMLLSALSLATADHSLHDLLALVTSAMAVLYYRPDPNESPYGRPDPALQSATNQIQSSDQDFEAVMK